MQKSGSDPETYRSNSSNNSSSAHVIIKLYTDVIPFDRANIVDDPNDVNRTYVHQ